MDRLELFEVAKLFAHPLGCSCSILLAASRWRLFD